MKGKDIADLLRYHLDLCGCNFQAQRDEANFCRGLLVGIPDRFHTNKYDMLVAYLLEMSCSHIVVNYKFWQILTEYCKEIEVIE